MKRIGKKSKRLYFPAIKGGTPGTRSSAYSDFVGACKTNVVSENQEVQLSGNSSVEI